MVLCMHVHTTPPPPPADSLSAFLIFLLKALLFMLYRESQRLSGFTLPPSSFCWKGTFPLWCALPVLAPFPPPEEWISLPCLMKLITDAGNMG